MTVYSKLNIIYKLQKWMDSVPGQTFLNYAYSWGASIVILGTLFKLTHLPGANCFLFLGMGTEVVVFFLSAFDRPFDKTTDGMDLDIHPEMDAESDTLVNGEPARAAVVGGGGSTVIGGTGGGTVIGGTGGGSVIGATGDGPVVGGTGGGTGGDTGGGTGGGTGDGTGTGGGTGGGTEEGTGSGGEAGSSDSGDSGSSGAFPPIPVGGNPGGVASGGTSIPIGAQPKPGGAGSGSGAPKPAPAGGAPAGGGAKPRESAKERLDKEMMKQTAALHGAVAGADKAREIAPKAGEETARSIAAMEGRRVAQESASQGTGGFTPKPVFESKPIAIGGNTNGGGTSIPIGGKKPGES